MKGPTEGQAAPVPGDPSPSEPRAALHSQSGAGTTGSDGTAFPRPVLQRRWWPYPLVWLVPILALVLAGFYYRQWHRDRGPEITLRFSDASGVKAGDTTVTYRGTDIGQVTGVDLSDDAQQVLVKVRLRRSTTRFATQGSVFWIERPEITAESVRGLGTIVTGPYIAALPGTGQSATDFTGLARPPIGGDAGLEVILHAARADRVQADAPLYYRGIQVGIVRDVRLAPDATRVNISLLVWRPYRQLVRSNSEFWSIKPADIQGGVFTGVKLSLGSLRSLIQGGIAFASPEDPVGLPVEDRKEFSLHEEPKDWQKWTPRLPVDDAEPSK